VASGPIENCHLDLDYGSNKMTAFGLGTLSAIFESWRTILQIKKTKGTKLQNGKEDLIAI
jgi:hypothetical protein